MAELADYNRSWPGQRIFTNLELFFNNLIEFQGLKGVHAARIVYGVCIYCCTADKYTQIYLKQGTRGEHTSAYGIRLVSAFGLWLTHSNSYPNRMAGWISGSSRY